MKKYVVQDLVPGEEGDDGIWFERPERFSMLRDAIVEAYATDSRVQIVSIPDGNVVWSGKGS